MAPDGRGADEACPESLVFMGGRDKPGHEEVERTHGRQSGFRSGPAQRGPQDLCQRRPRAALGGQGLGLRCGVRAGRWGLGGAAAAQGCAALSGSASGAALRRPQDHRPRHRPDEGRAHRRDPPHPGRQRHGARRAPAPDGHPRREGGGEPGPAQLAGQAHHCHHRGVQGAVGGDRDAGPYALHLLHPLLAGRDVRHAAELAQPPGADHRPDRRDPRWARTRR